MRNLAGALVPGCTCLWMTEPEGELEGQMMFVLTVLRADKRCVKHGKPRHADRIVTVRFEQQMFDTLRRVAKEADCTVSDLIRRGASLAVEALRSQAVVEKPHDG